ncbi:hypothetical protein [Oceanibacterium hippocampi]|uniref:Ferric reductase like transmembrane component n=1 Tax=Oceanibacterium hippocampi TaxID=745714 RepID=A0A1Y5TCG8_9PROT|nr:hypothetical protein [Oceanibacterium hippocampi]SLN57291.1 Ferric reductase like transmembrane component [Oceanibacterium hippocampi]
MHESVLVYRGFRFLKIAVLLGIVAIIAYAVDQPLGVPNGGTWLGYTLGTIGALLILWLMWFGMRKRRYYGGANKLQGWLSAHVYLGLALIVVATLHTGFQFGWNLHTLAYALMILVIVSGVFGIYAYARYPRLMTENRHGKTSEQLLRDIAELDEEARSAALTLGDEINAVVLEAANKTKIGGGLGRMLSGEDRNCPTARGLVRVEELAASASGKEATQIRRLAGILSRKNELLRQARRDVRFLALMQIWLYIHVPISFALLAALIAHVIAVFFYW